MVGIKILNVKYLQTGVLQTMKHSAFSKKVSNIYED